MGRKIFTREKSTNYVIVLVVFPPEVQTSGIEALQRRRGGSGLKPNPFLCSEKIPQENCSQPKTENMGMGACRPGNPASHILAYCEGSLPSPNLEMAPSAKAGPLVA